MANTNANKNINLNIEQADELLDELVADINFGRIRNSEISKNGEQGFATISKQTSQKNGSTYFVIYNAHLARTKFLTALHIELNEGEQQALEQGIKDYKSGKNNDHSRHNITKGANVVEQLIEQDKLALFNIKYNG